MSKLFAVPTENGQLCAHFGHCEKFAIVETEEKKIIKEAFVKPPVHEPGVYPQFLAQQGVSVIISGGMGMKAQQLFSQNNIEVCVGVNSGAPSDLVQQYLDNKLQTSQNLCDH